MRGLPCQHSPQLCSYLDPLTKQATNRPTDQPTLPLPLPLPCLQAIDSLVRVQAELLDYSVNSVTGELCWLQLNFLLR